jgi:ankyrin repeat protein
VDKGDFARVKQLVADGADVNQRDWRETTSLLKALDKGKVDIACFLIEKGADIHARDSQGNNPLLYACKLNLLDMVQYLIENGASVDVRNKYGHSAILNACWQIGGKDSICLSEVKRRQYEIVKLLVANGANVNDSIIPHGYTPLSMACVNDNIELVKYLIAHQAEINVTDGVGFRMICWACCYHANDTQLIRFLLSKGAKADIDCVLNPIYEYMPLMNACRNGAEL